MIFNETELNKHWYLKRLDELGDFKRGKSKHRPRNDVKLFENGHIPLVQTGDIKAANIYIYIATEFYNEFGLKQSKIWHKGTLCITIAANIAETAILNESMCFPDSVVGFVPFDGETTSVYMHYLFAFVRYRIQNSVQGSIQDNINIDYLTKLKFRIPRFEIQQRIASILCRLDDKIGHNNCINAELEQMAKTLYDYWFVQFDFPDVNGKPYKSSGGKMVYNEELKREVPEGWEVRTLGEYVVIKKGTLITEKVADSKGNIKVVSAGLDFSYYHSEANFKENTITVSASGASAGYVNFWREPIFACDCTTVKGQNLAETYYVLEFLKLMQDHIYKQARGSAQPHVYPKDIEILNVVIPNEKLLRNYSSIIEPINQKISNNLQQNQQLSTFRDWLLPMLMNGQVKIVDQTLKYDLQQ